MNRGNINFNVFFPKNFFDKGTNEKFQLFLIGKIIDSFNEDDVEWGNPRKNEPDLIINNVPFELTLASTVEDTSTFIKKIIEYTLKSNNVEELLIECIIEACNKKTRKQYCTVDNTLSILLVMPVYIWCAPLYSSIPELLPPNKLPKLLFDIKTQYIDNGKFKDVLIHMPGFSYDWFSCSCKDCRIINWVQLDDDQISSGNYPYIVKIGSLTTDEVEI